MCQNFVPWRSRICSTKPGTEDFSGAQAVAADEPQGGPPAGLAEQRKTVDGHARGADLLQHRPKRLRDALEVCGIERSGERDVEPVLAQHMRIAEALQQETLMVVEGHAGLRSGASRGLGETVEGGDALRREPIESGRRLDWAKHEIAAGARQRQRTSLHPLP